MGDDGRIVHQLFDFYEAAAEKAGVPMEDVVRQFKAECVLPGLAGRCCDSG